VVRNLLNEQELQDLTDAVDYFKQTAQANDPDLEFGSNELLERVRFPCEKHEAFYKLQRSAKLLDCVEDLIGGSFRYMPQDKLNCKLGGGSAAIPWHQDWAHFPHTNRDVLTTCVVLNDSTRENGCLQVIPGSHKGGLWSHHTNGEFRSNITDTSFRADNPVYLEAPAGSVTIHNALAVHGSARNTSLKSRTTVCFIWNAMDAWPLFGVAGRDFKNYGPVCNYEFNKTMVRGKPSINIRMEALPVSMPVPFEGSPSVIDDGLQVPEPQP